jgi:hypothetical protein
MLKLQKYSIMHVNLDGAVFSCTIGELDVYFKRKDKFAVPIKSLPNWCQRLINGLKFSAECRFLA